MSWATATFNNLRTLDVPVLRQEMRVRQRGVKPFGVMFAYLAILTLISLFVLNTTSAFVSQSHHSVHQVSATQSQLAQAGRQLFSVLSFTQLLMILLIVPSYSSGTISTERERGTFDMLALTPLRSTSIITQKLVAAMAQAVMLMFSSLPIVSVVFLLGGVSPMEVFTAYLLLFLTATMVASFGVLTSSLFASSRTSTFVTYFGVFTFYAGFPLLSNIFSSVRLYGVPSAAAGAGLMFFLAPLFCAGILALLIYAPVGVYFRRKGESIYPRPVRMLTFVGVYAVVLLFMLSSALHQPSSHISVREGLDLFNYVNAFAAMEKLMRPYATYGSLSTRTYDARNMTVALTLFFSGGCAYLFRQLSTARFERLRRP